MPSMNERRTNAIPKQETECPNDILNRKGTIISGVTDIENTPHGATPALSLFRAGVWRLRPWNMTQRQATEEGE